MRQPKPIKYLPLILLFLLSAQIVAANAIDDLKTDSDVLNLLVKLDTNFLSHGKPYIEILPTNKLIPTLKCGDVARQWDVKTWEKVDFNLDSLTDLLVTVKNGESAYVYAIIDNGHGALKLLRLSRGCSGDCQMAKPIVIDNKQMLLFYSQKFRFDGNRFDFTKKVEQIDTLIYLYDDFTEFSSKPANYDVKSIFIKTTGCYGTCPIFQLTVFADGNAVYNADQYNPKAGNFKGIISGDKVSQLFSLVNYIDIKKLKDDYEVSWSDDQTAYIKIEFSDGSVKAVNDYGMIGTFGLSNLYSLLFDLRNTERWTPTNTYKFNIPPVKLSH